MLAVIDYGAGNLRSVAKALEHVGASPIVTSRPEDVRRASALVLPGVGAATGIMQGLKEHDLANEVVEHIVSGRPFMGVCMGLQALLTQSDEEDVECLDVVAGRVRKLPPGQKVPHMGWNQVCRRTEHPIFAGIPDGAFFYFVHSYYVSPTDESVVAATTDYGVTFPSVIARDNLVATQFHPEKSSEHGLAMYRNFLEWARRI
ncbi:MAG: imidazole glycerol phosphate synthase subunit HisH [Chloroflexi bacterium]|nr:imidazole glycerol phosphate synthase subunit HisH [Chloroflexota bacterium]